MEIIANRFEAKGSPEVDEAKVCLSGEEIDNKLRLFLDHFVNLLQCGDFCVEAVLLESSVIVSTKCCTKALL